MDAVFTHQIRVRYGDCDMQGVVFNPNYFVYLDDTMDVWIQSKLGQGYMGQFDYVVKKASLEWDAPARVGEVVEMRPEVTRWGRTSFDVSVALSVGERSIGVGELVLISIEPGSHDPKPLPVPDKVRNALGG